MYMYIFVNTAAFFTKHTTTAPPAAQICPAGHGSQLVAPAELVVPAEHCTGATVGSEHSEPAGQMVQAVLPVPVA